MLRRRLVLTSWVVLAFGCGLPEGGLGEHDDPAPAAPVEASAPPFHDAGLASDTGVEASTAPTGAGDAAGGDHEAGVAPGGGSTHPGDDEDGDDEDDGDDGSDQGQGQGKSK